MISKLRVAQQQRDNSMCMKTRTCFDVCALVAAVAVLDGVAAPRPPRVQLQALHATARRISAMSASCQHAPVPCQQMLAPHQHHVSAASAPHQRHIRNTEVPNVQYPLKLACNGQHLSLHAVTTYTCMSLLAYTPDNSADPTTKTFLY